MALQLRARLVYTPIPGAGEQAAALAARRMDRLGARIVTNARGRVTVRSGALRDSIGHRTTVAGDQVRLLVSATAPHAKFVHDGTRPHEIRPRRVRALRFEMGPRLVFAARVWHPGTRANPFLTDAAREEIQRGV